MAKMDFTFTYADNRKSQYTGPTGAYMTAEKENGDTFSVDELLECLRPAAMKLRDAYKLTISNLFYSRSGEFLDSIDIEDGDFAKLGCAYIIVKPFGTRKKGKYLRKSRAGESTAKYAKHNRKVSASRLRNDELGYLLEFGTPRISATHWMERTNDDVGEHIQDMIEEEFDKLLKSKGL